MTQRYRFFLLLVISFFLVSARANATMMIPLDFEHLTSLAQRIFWGTVVSVDSGFDKDGRSCQFIEFDVLKAYKGIEGKRLQIKMLNPNPVRIGKNIVQSAFVPGLPSFIQGTELVVFLNGDSKLGLTSPAGFGQGVFDISKDPFGDKRALNRFQNAGLFKGMQVQPAFKAQGIDEKRLQALKSEPQNLYLDQLKSLIKSLTTSNTEAQ